MASDARTAKRSHRQTRLGRPRGGIRREDRVEDVLAVAARLFRERGYRATGLDQIADELGVTRAALYYYFDTKQELLEAICGKSMDAVESALQEVQAVPDAAERLGAFARAFARNTATDSARVFFRDAKELGPEARQRLRERAHRVTRGAEEIVEAGIASGRFRGVNVHVAAPGLLAMLNSLPDWVRSGRHGSLESVTEQLLDLFLHGICAPAGAPTP
jgi:AcrR family transcriptional regulator